MMQVPHLVGSVLLS